MARSSTDGKTITIFAAGEKERTVTNDVQKEKDGC